MYVHEPIQTICILPSGCTGHRCALEHLRIVSRRRTSEFTSVCILAPGSEPEPHLVGSWVWGTRSLAHFRQLQCKSVFGGGGWLSRL